MLVQLKLAETRVLKLEAQPQLLLPDQITFNQVQIPALDTAIACANQRMLEVIDSSQLDQSNWTISVRQALPLTSETGKQLTDRLTFLDQGQTFTINSVDQLIFKGSGSTKIDLAKHLKLMLHPSDETGKYQGTLVWNLADAPS